MTTQEHLSQAIITLQQASAADMAGEAAATIELYTAAIQRFEAVQVCLPETCQVPVNQHLAAARQRLGELKSERNRKVHSSLPRFNHEFTPQAPPVGMDGPFMCPAASVGRPFWLMQVLSRSLQTGAFISPDLYVARQVWFQEGAAQTVKNIGAKVRYLSNLCEAMEPLSIAGASLHDTALVSKQLETFLKGAEEIRTVFDTERGKPSSAHAPLQTQRSLLERGMSSLLSKGSHMIWGKKGNNDGSYNSYVAWAANALEQGQLFDKMLTYYTQFGNSGSSQKSVALIFERLHRISATLFFGCCTFILQDALLLAERFADKGRESSSRLLPCDLKIDD